MGSAYTRSFVSIKEGEAYMPENLQHKYLKLPA
jgi:hypothetical protein